MDFSGIYEDQQFWRGKEVSRVEARDIPGTNCYCDEDAMNAIRSRIAPYSSVFCDLFYLFADSAVFPILSDGRSEKDASVSFFTRIRYSGL